MNLKKQLLRQPLSYNAESLIRKTALVFCGLLITTGAFAQEEEGKKKEKEETEEDEWADEKQIHCFYDTRVINGHSTETLEKGTLDFRITHRFGNIGTPTAGRTLWGLDNSTDIRIAFEYAPTDHLLFGFGRSKGASPYSEFWDGFAKYSILKQSKDMPVSLTWTSSIFATSMSKSNDSTILSSFPTVGHRFSYYNQLIIAKQFFDVLTVQVAPGVLHRNYVYSFDQNTNVVLGGMLRYNFYKKMSLVAEYYHVFREASTGTSGKFYDPLAFGLEIKTYAHVFQLNFMNSEGLGEGQFIPYTGSKWKNGQFRFGFTISREF